MLLRFLPWLLCFGAGFAACLVLVARSRPPGAARDWEAKYRDIFQRYRELTERLQTIDRDSELKAARLRKTLGDVREILRGAAPGGPDAARRALDEIDAALRAS